MNITDIQVIALKHNGWRYVRAMGVLQASKDPQKDGWEDVGIKTLPSGPGVRNTRLNYGDIMDLEEL